MFERAHRIGKQFLTHTQKTAEFKHRVEDAFIIDIEYQVLDFSKILALRVLDILAD